MESNAAAPYRERAYEELSIACCPEASATRGQIGPGLSEKPTR
jgi:hypothetical protein